MNTPPSIDLVARGRSPARLLRWSRSLVQVGSLLTALSSLGLGLSVFMSSQDKLAPSVASQASNRPRQHHPGSGEPQSSGPPAEQLNPAQLSPEQLQQAVAAAASAGLAGTAPMASESELATAKPPRSRELLVNTGSERYELYLRGRRLGMTPFAGQVLCADGEMLDFALVPAKGMPKLRKVLCKGDALIYH